ncbi:MAG: hypothetical protein J5598_00610 [Clostridia bacterium]|nr:hypothetical protein [Clostridia bacterium]
MRIVQNFCTQPRKYADSEGRLVIELEPNDDIQAIIKKYEKKRINWWDEECVFVPSKSNERQLYFRRHQPYLD